MKTASSSASGKFSTAIDILSVFGLGLALPAALHVCGNPKPAAFLQASLGAFGAPSTLLLAFLGTGVLRLVFGTVRRAFPPLAGLVACLLFFGAVFDLPGLGFLKAGAAKLPGFAGPGPAFFSGLASLVLGSLLGLVDKSGSFRRGLVAVAFGLVTFIVLAGLHPFPKVDARVLSVEGVLKELSATLGREYHDPEVEAAVRRVVEDKDKSLAEKEAEIARLSSELRRVKEDRAALEKAAADASRLGKELEEAKAALAAARLKAETASAPLKGGSYAEAVTPFDPVVRDFAVGIARAAPGAFDGPQGSFLPTAQGLRQAVLVQAAISGQWNYVSDPGVAWSDYVSPARRSIALGLAGDCDDFAVLMASCLEAIGGMARIMAGRRGGEGHAWAELWLGKGSAATQRLEALAGIVGRPAAGMAATRDAEGGLWLACDWRLGEYALKADSFELLWTGGR